MGKGRVKGSESNSPKKYKQTIDSFDVTTEVLEKFTDTLIYTIEFTMEDNRKYSVKQLHSGDLKSKVDANIRQFLKPLLIASNTFKKDFILVTNIPELIDKKVLRKNCQIEIYLYPHSPFQFKYLERRKIKELVEGENIILDVLAILDEFVRTRKYNTQQAENQGDVVNNMETVNEKKSFRDARIDVVRLGAKIN